MKPDRSTFRFPGLSMNFADLPSNLLSKVKHKIESKYVELKSLGVNSKMFEIMRKWLDNLGQTLYIAEK